MNDLMPVSEAAKACGVPPETVARLIGRGWVRLAPECARRGAALMVSPNAVRRALERCAQR